jgi:ribosomal protein S18 acetylase RimI-like enzyme
MEISNRNIVIQKIRYHDLHHLGIFFAKSFGDEVHPTHIQQRIHRIRQFYYFLRPLAHLSPWIKNLFNIYVIKVNGVMAGFLQVSYPHQKQLHLDYIAIHKNYRGQGLGSWILRRLLETVVDGNGVTAILEVRSDNPAYRLYKHLSFVTQASILHYEKSFKNSDFTLAPPIISGLRKLQDSDRPQLYSLHYHSVSKRLHAVLKREYRDFTPSLFIRQLEWAKNRIMSNVKDEYVVEKNAIIVAELELRSYPNVATHIINLMLHPEYEVLRTPLMKYALWLLQRKYKQGQANINIYDDAISKQQTLEKLGFTRKAVYYLMSRFPKPIALRPVIIPHVAPFPENKARETRTYRGGAHKF